MGHMSTDSEIVRNFLTKLNTLIMKYITLSSSTSSSSSSSTSNSSNSNSGYLSTQEYANAMWGLRCMDSKYIEVN